MDKIFILGTGIMGQGIAQVFLQSGFNVTIYNRDINKCELLKENLKKILIEKVKKTEKESLEILSKLRITTDLENVKEADFIIESLIENINIKKDYFNKIDKLAKKEAILATNTSSLSITEISSEIKNSKRVIGMHFFNPAPLMKLIEIVKGLNTAEEVVNKVKKICDQIDKEYVLVDEIPGFIVNRLLIPMINEAILLLENKISSKEDIDKAMKLGGNHPLGPLQLSDLIGNDIVLNIMQTLHKETGDSKYRPCFLLKKYVNAGKLGRKTKEGFYKYE